MAKKIIYEIIKQIWRRNCWPSSLLKARTFIHIICDWVSFGRLPTTPIIRQHHRSFTSVLMLQLQICESERMLLRFINMWCHLNSLSKTVRERECVCACLCFLLLELFLKSLFSQFFVIWISILLICIYVNMGEGVFLLNSLILIINFF